ncbi:hypothetical protein BH24CHL6_BH24CHL6_09160 [soil metagenome]
MAQRALPAGAVRRRTVFGLLDADGWTWASIKATFWFLLIIFLLGYLPDRAYYFTVSPTIDVGFNAISPINLCPAENRLSTCPAPAGAMVPWQESPPELALPEPRAEAGVYSSGESVYLIGGRTAEGATSSVLSTLVAEGNLSPWEEGPALPEARSDAAVINITGVPYVIGGRDEDGSPTDTVFRGTVEEGLLTGWEQVDDLALPQPLAELSGVATINGAYVFGGRDAEDALSDAVYHAEFDTATPPQLQPWQERTQLPLPEPRADATALVIGNFIYVLGGEGPEGPSNLVFMLGIDFDAQPQVDTRTGQPFGWGVSVGPAEAFAIPEARTRHASFTNAGAIYVLGGEGPDGALHERNLWAVPDTVTGTIPEWRRLGETDLLAARLDATVLAIAGHGFVIGGETAEGLSDGLERADLAPQPPFFRLGLFGATVPGLGITGNVGQELGWLAAAGIATGNFVLMILVGWAYSHPRQTQHLIERVSRGRIRAPRAEEESYR